MKNEEQLVAFGYQSTLEYMEKQVQKHTNSLKKEIERNAPVEQLDNIRNKIRHYEIAIESLKESWKYEYVR